jgi:hypothetical protein
MKDLKFKVHNKVNFSEKERTTFLEALEEAKKVINSSDFKDRAVNLPLEQTNGFSPLEIYNKFISGADSFNTEEDGYIDVHITMYHSFKNTVGYTYPTTWFTWINRKFFSRFDHAEIAGHVIHEYMHNVGFGHKSAGDKNSVPYAYGYLVRDMIRELSQVTPLNQKPSATHPTLKNKVAGFFKRIF